MTYLNVDEVDSAILALASNYPAISQLITLPHQTYDGRTCHALRVGTQPVGAVPTYYLTGGVHAREWGSCEILVNLATDLLTAYTNGNGLGYGNKSFSAAEVKALVERANVVVFPCVNPDGRHYSQTSVSLWRKNRNPADATAGQDATVGVDINRNQDFLWDFRTAFAASAINYSTASDVTADETYHGHAPTSEAETKNINYIHDNFGPVAWYIDVHSYSEDMLGSWGDDENQTFDTGMTFRNHSHDHQRGLIGDGYSEYIPDGDLALSERLAHAFTSCLAEVRGKFYVAKPAFSLYPTSGTNDDYAYSRHFVDPSKANSTAYTIEWGTEFQPAWAEMAKIVTEVTAGCINLGLTALGTDSFIVTDRDTFSSYEVQTTPDYPAALYVIYDGFSPNMLGGGPTVDVVDMGGNVIPSITASISATELEQPGNLNAAQRVKYTVDIHFADTSAFTAETVSALARARLAGMQDVAPVELVTQPNPYLVDGAISWLSTDVRVFQLRPNESIGSSSTTLASPATDPHAPNTYIQNLVTELRGHGNSPAAAFENLSQDESSSRLELSQSVHGAPVFNFALAKVRYRANSQPAGDVRVFFRTFNTMVSDLSYDMLSGSLVQNYRRSTNGTVPLLGFNKFFSGAGSQITSIPYFASPRIDSSSADMSAQPDPTNTHTIDPAGTTEAVMYFGCWLDFNQGTPQFPAIYPNADGHFSNRVPIPQIIRGLHQCLVAEIRFQPGSTDPIPTGATPVSSDRLAQRNLSIVESDNPGDADSHRVQHTLLIKPSRPQNTKAATTGRLGTSDLPDELVFDFGDLPPATELTLYFPDITADEILTLAARRPGPTRLARVDPHTVSARADAALYVPVPSRDLPGLPGLMTMQLPTSVRTGEVFHVDVQQHSGQTATFRVGRSHEAAPSAVVSRRKVLGAFRMSTVVRAGAPLLARSEQDLAVLKYIRAGIPVADSWAPVFDRWIAQQGAHVGSLGGDPESVPASLDYPPASGQHGHHSHECHTGRVEEIRYDCRGDVTGFTLRDCEHVYTYETREPAIAELLLRACKDRLTITVCRHEGHGRISRIVVGCDC